MKKPIHLKKAPKKPLSNVMIFMLAAGVAGLGYLAGATQERWLAYVSPLFGIQRSAETIDLSSVQRTFQYLKANYDGQLDTQKLIDGANHGLVNAAGDIHTVYLDSEEADEFNKDLEGNVGAGIGALIGVRNDQPTVTKVLPDNPAFDAGVKQGDVIISVNGESANGWTADTASGKIRGEAGTSVKIVVNRAGQEQTFTITRQTINNPSVSGEVRNGVGILTISRFDSQTGSLARKQAESFKEQGVKGVIVDVRSDGGGYLGAAVDVASLWLSDKLVVTQKTNGKVISSERTENRPVLNGLKTIVLVNGGTASASEILASALRDNDAATLVGEKTYGKGSVQQLIDVGGGNLLKVTVAHWYTPKGINIDKKGLTPNIDVKLTDQDANAGRDPQLDEALNQASR